MHVDQHQVRPVALAQVAPLADAEQVGGRVRGLAYQLLDAQVAVVHHLQGHAQRMLHQRQARGRLEVGGVVFLLPGVRGVVGGDDVDAVFGQRLAQRTAIFRRLDRRVALDQGIALFVVGIAEIQVMHAGLGSDALALYRAGFEQRHLACRGQVQYVQPGAVLLGQFDRHGGRLPACLLAADQRVEAHRDLLAVPLAVVRLVDEDGGRVLAMGHHLGRGVAEDGLQDGGIVDQHVAGRGPHEHLDAAGLVRAETADLVDIVVGAAEVERVVAPGPSGSQRELVLQGIQGHGLRVGVGHVEEAGDPAGHRRARFSGDVRLVGHARLAEMHLVVDHTGHQGQSRGIDHLCAVRRNLTAQALDTAVADQQVALGHLAFVHHAGILDQDRAHQS